MGAHPPSITPSFPDHKTETNGHQCCDFKGRSNLPIRLNGGARWEFFNEKPGSSWLPPKKQWLLRVDIFGGYLLVLFKKMCFHFLFIRFPHRLSQVQICHLQSENLLTVWILICWPTWWHCHKSWSCDIPFVTYKVSESKMRDAPKVVDRPSTTSHELPMKAPRRNFAFHHLLQVASDLPRRIAPFLVEKKGIFTPNRPAAPVLTAAWRMGYL